MSPKDLPNEELTKLSFSFRHRPRRNRRSEGIRRLVRENHLLLDDMVMPYFVCEGKDKKVPISAMPGQYRWSFDLLINEIQEIYDFGVSAIALFPAIDESKKDKVGTEAWNPKGLIPETVRKIKKAVPEMVVITDVALDPYSADGHDGIVEEGQVLNDPTLEALARMATVQAQAGADLVAPSDMMDGRVKYIRQRLDTEGFNQTGILAYSAKYASSFYGPFREALDSAPKAGDKKTYQMDPANFREALREVSLDIQEGADMVMVKPALAYLDVIQTIRKRFSVPVAAYQVSGEYSLIKMGGEKGILDEKQARDETLLAIKRAGADIILSYFTKEIAEERAAY